jgi:hypothetical protein
VDVAVDEVTVDDVAVEDAAVDVAVEVVAVLDVAVDEAVVDVASVADVVVVGTIDEPVVDDGGRLLEVVVEVDAVELVELVVVGTVDEVVEVLVVSRRNVATKVSGTAGMRMPWVCPPPSDQPTNTQVSPPRCCGDGAESVRDEPKRPARVTGAACGSSSISTSRPSGWVMTVNSTSAGETLRTAGGE